MQKARSLYIHFPFCEAKCHYCDFYSLGRERTRTGDPATFEAALRREIELNSEGLDSVLETIFLGGGTPSMTPPESMRRALAPLWTVTSLTTETEWTMEANPSSVDLQRLKDYRSLGVNRISMGVQALRDDLLERLGRVHSRKKALQALDAIFGAGFENVSVDLLCGVPGQSLQDLEEALRILTDYPITHLSCYLLTLPSHHRMYSELPTDQVQLEHLLTIHDWMARRGFEHYEISNFARPGFKARHNLAYWKGFSYLGLGPSAHSYDASAQTRWKNVSSLHKYASLLDDGKLPRDFQENLTQDQLQLERWMLTLRLDEGFPESWLEAPIQRARASRFQQEGLMERHPREADRLRLTPRGYAVSDAVIRGLAVI